MEGAGDGNQGGGEGGKNGNDGGQGDGGLFDDSQGGGDGGGDGGSGGAGGNKDGAGGSGDPDKKGGSGGEGITIPDNWKESLPEELRDGPGMANIKTLDQLVKSYYNAQKLVGAEKIAIPGKNASDDELRKVFQKLGLAEKAEEYSIPELEALKMGEDVDKAFTAKAFELGVLPKQAKALAEYFVNQVRSEQESEVKRMNDQIGQEFVAFKKEQGAAYGETMARAKAALREYADPEVQAFMKANNLSHSVPMIKFLAKMGEGLTEDKILRDGGTGDNIPTPALAKEKIASLMGDLNGPYHNVDHVDHAATKREVARLYQYAYPKK